MNTDLNALLHSAHSHATAGRYQEAIPEYQSALKLDPQNINAHFDLHLTYVHTGQLLLGLQELEEAARLSPSDSDIYFSRVRLYDVLALNENALHLQELVSHLPGEAKDRHVLLGLRAYQQQEYPQALAHFEDALREQPDTPYIQGYIGRTLIYLSRNMEAREALTTVANNGEVRPADLYNLAMAERNLRNYAAAVPALERAVQIDKAYYKAWTMLASTEWRLGHWRSAWHHFRQAVKCSPQMQEQNSKTAA